MNNDWAVSIDLTDAYLHVPKHPQSREKSSIHPQRSDIPIHDLTFRKVPKSVDFYQIDGRYSSASTSTYHLSFSVPRRLANKKI